MILIADSGSTKTDWCLASDKEVVARVNTQGLNPFHLSKEQAEKIIRAELLPGLGVPAADIDAVFFYGAGCVGFAAPAMEETLEDVFQKAERIEVHSDLMAAARALLGRGSGIACILGTGSNSCLYEDGEVAANVPPLGYILGDEGSGAVLGRMFFNGIFKGGLPQEICRLYTEETGYDYFHIIDKVYREPLANRFLASASTFINAHKEEFPQLRELVVANFRSFFANNIARYNRRGAEIGAVGSIAYYYEEELRKVAELEGYAVANVEKTPMDGLLRYHATLNSKL